jgi:hypothetical protein
MGFMRRQLFRSLCFAALVTAGSAACVADRPRPDPVTIHDQPLLTANVDKPNNNATVLGVHPVDIRIFGSELEHSTLTGVGYVVRRNGVRVDSVVTRFTERHDTTVVFSYVVPDYPTNTHLAIFGLAFGPDETFAVSPATLITVVRCAPNIQGC